MMQLTRNRVAASRILALGVLLAALLAASLLLAAKPSHASTTFTVNSVEDHSDAVLTIGACDTGYQVPGSGSVMEKECTLRAAIEQANFTAGADTINFAIPGSDVKTIAPATALPEITGSLTINGYSQPGAKPNTKAVGSDAVLKIELSGAGAPGADGLRIGAANSTVKGLVINRWHHGIRIDGSDATGNRVTGNYIGTDASGTQNLGNSRGVYIPNASNNTIGGATVAERNVISGNGENGVSIDAGTRANKVMGNYIGTDASGTKDLGNGYNGVYINGSNNTIGGTTAGTRNVISGNFVGVAIYGAGSTGNRVTGNYVGTDKNGTAPLANAVGVSIYEASNNYVGGTTAGARNVISASLYDGVSIRGAGATGNRVLSNSIYSNGELGIDLVGTTANDPDDPDTGPNNLQNFPVLSSARKSVTGTTTIKGKLDSTPGKTYKLQFFSNPKGTDEGKTLLGSKTVSTDGSGDVSFAFSTNRAIRLGQNVTATATGPGGNTSEFSAARRVVAR